MRRMHAPVPHGTEWKPSQRRRLLRGMVFSKFVGATIVITCVVLSYRSRSTSTRKWAGNKTGADTTE